MIRLIAIAAFGLAVATSAQPRRPRRFIIRTACTHRRSTDEAWRGALCAATMGGVGVGVGVGRYYGGRYCPGEYHYWNGVACVDARGYSYVNRPYVNRGYVNRGYVNRGYVNRGHVNRGYVNRGYANRGYVSRGYVNRVSVNRGSANRGRGTGRRR